MRVEEEAAVPVVAFPDARADPRAVVVHVQNAPASYFGQIVQKV